VWKLKQARVTRTAVPEPLPGRNSSRFFYENDSNTLKIIPIAAAPAINPTATGFKASLNLSMKSISTSIFSFIGLKFDTKRGKSFLYDEY